MKLTNYSLSLATALFACLWSPTTASPLPTGLDISPALQNILDNTDRSKAYTYPTDLTQGIIPKAIHSHNDYWRPVPFYTALAVGCISTESDVWLINGTLHVGHELAALTADRTFDSLYIQPILSVLNKQNPSTPYTSGGETKNGVFDTDGSQTLYLFVDLKTDGATTFPEVIKALAPLRDAGYLTTWDGTAITPGAVTVIGTGNTPLNQIQGVAPRDYFYDAPLPLLSSTFANITSSISPIASTDFAAVFGSINGTAFSASQLATLKSQIAVAQAKGIMSRYWDTPAWPISTRNAVWRTLTAEGVGLINADEVAEAAGFGGIAGYW